MPLEEDIVRDDEDAPETVPVPRSLVPHLSETAILLDIDGTLLDLMPTPREVWVPPGLAKTLNRLLERTNGALALVSGRSLNDIDLIFAPDQFPAVGGHGAEMRIEPDSEAVAAPCAADGQGIEATAGGDREAQPGNSAGRQGLFAGAALSPRAACGEGDLCGGVADPGRSAERADRGAARQMRLRDQAFRFHQGDRRARVDDA